MPKKLILFILLTIICPGFMLTQTEALAAQKDFFKRANEKKELQQFIKIHQRSLTGDPRNPETQDARFAVAEYYFKNNNIYNAKTVFKQYINDYPPQISTFIGQVFLYKIAKLQNDSSAMDKLRKEIFAKPFIILFSDYETLEYTSTFGNKYTVRNYLDRVEVFINDHLFEEIKP